MAEKETPWRPARRATGAAAELRPRRVTDREEKASRDAATFRNLRGVVATLRESILGRAARGGQARSLSYCTLLRRSARAALATSSMRPIAIAHGDSSGTGAGEMTISGSLFSGGVVQLSWM